MQLINGQLNLSNGLNTSGSTIFTGSVNITGSLTASLTNGYTWVGNANNVSTLVSTSSFGGSATIPAGTVSGSSQISIAGTSDYSSLFGGVASATSSLNQFTASINGWSGSIATTGSNTFRANQIITGSLSVNGVISGSSDMVLSGVGSTTSAPRLVGITPYVAGNAAQFIFGDNGNTIQNAFGGLMQIVSYHGMQIYGGKAGAASFVTSVASTDPSLNVIGTGTTRPTLVATAAGSQTANIQEWRNSSNIPLVAISSAGAISSSNDITAANHIGVIKATNGVVSGSSQVSIAGTSDYTSLFTGIASSTSSLNTFTSSAAPRLTNLETTTASLNISITNLNSYSASVSNSIQQLNSFTASNFTSQLNSFTASAALRLTNLETTSASVNISVTNLNTYSASVSNSILNLNTLTSSLVTTYEGRASATKTLFSGSSQVTFTQLSGISAGIVSSSAQIVPLLPTGVVSGSSQVLGGTGIISSSAQLSGTTITNLTVVNLTTVNQTASVVFSSGSNTFGDAGNDIHSFTGSLAVSGSSSFTGSINISGSATIAGGLGIGTVNTTVGTIQGGTGIIAGTYPGINGFLSLNGQSSYAGTEGIIKNVTNQPMFISDYHGVALYSNGSLMARFGSQNAGVATSYINQGNFLIGTSTDNGYKLNIASPSVSGSLYVSGSSSFTGSINVSGGITGSLFGTASYATTASFALNGSSNATLVQSSAASTWTFNHYLQTRYPIIQIYDNTDSVIIPQSITAVDTNTTTITFSSARTGTAVASKGGYVGSVVASATIASSSVSASVATTASYAISASAAATTFSIGAATETYGSYINTIQGANTIISTPTGSFAGAFYKYVATSGSNARAGEVMAIWNNTTTQFTDVTTNDIGSTTMVTSSVSLSAGNAVLSFTTNTNNWNIKTFVTYL
jgi:hypothetical protein